MDGRTSADCRRLRLDQVVSYSDQAAIKRIAATTAVPANMPTRIANPESQLNSFDIVHPM
jgi:hypothetical protein